MTNNQFTPKDGVRYFYCYNPNLRKFLDQNGVGWSSKGIHYKTKKPYWMFKRSSDLNKLIIKYKRVSNP